MPAQVVDDQIVDLPPKVTVGFERSIKVRDYESAKASVFVQADVAADADDAQIEAGIRDAFFQAKSIVFDELGVEFNVDDNSVVREAVERQLGPTSEVKSSGGGAPSRTTRPKSEATEGSATSAPASSDKAKPIVRDEACPKCNDPARKFWDNRADKAEGKVKANYPDFKCAEKSCRNGVWLTPKGS